uniref:Uncharacterized protein MANES_18G023000 n=1 Tax=Rhizophora mucronata TaxID=61149 RepID=A0A2P2JLH1_RHIMU
MVFNWSIVPAKYKRNWSFTKEEIEAYWNSKKKIQEEHLRAISSPSESESSQDGTETGDGLKHKRSSSLPSTKTKQSFMDLETEASFEKLVQTNGWWTRSNWAFLNEPPVIERSSNTYAAQFHIANLASSEANA